MGYFDSREELLTRLDTHYSNALTKYNLSLTKQSEAYTHYLGGEVLSCLYDTLWALGETNTAVGHLIFKSTGCQRNADILHYLDYFAGGEVTYQAICEAWGRDDFEGRAVTIAFIDRMRQLLWNEPFSAVFAAKPEEQEE
ncbi:hypothetical protein ES705_18531 [subsurface metagenome]